MMNDSEETIQRVLAGLRDAEAPPGMERRIVDALENRASGLTASSWRDWRPSWPAIWARFVVTQSWAGRIAVTAVLVICVEVAVKNFGHITKEPKLHSNVAGLLPQAVRAGDRQTVQPPSTDSSGRVRNATPVRRVRQSSVHDSAALTEMRAVSHPAPEAPLTEEEMLLVRIAHRADPQELAMLNPQVRARRDAESEAEFLKFVDDSTKGDSE